MATHQSVDLTIPIPSAQHSRVRHLVWPREHGAWGMLFVPLATGAAVGLMSGGGALQLVLLIVASFFLFCLRTPLESLWGTSVMKARTDEERGSVAWYLVVFATAAIASTAGLLAMGNAVGLLGIGAVAAAAFVMQTAIRLKYPRARMIAQVIGAVGLTSTAAAAYLVVTGHLGPRALALWAANWVFAGNQIHFVQVRLHSAKLTTVREKLARGAKFFDGQFAMLGALALAWGLHVLPALALIAFAPVFVRGCVWFFSGAQQLSVKRLGFTELAHALAFGVLLVVAFAK